MPAFPISVNWRDPPKLTFAPIFAALGGETPILLHLEETIRILLGLRDFFQDIEP
jgi:hypothetical protein